MKEIIISKLTIIEDIRDVVLITTNPSPLFIANGIITHNKDTGNQTDTVYCYWTNGDTSAYTNVEYSLNNGGSWSTQQTVSPGVSSYLVGYLTGPSTYQVTCRVRHTKNGGYNPSSGWVTAGSYVTAGGECPLCLLIGTPILMADGTLQSVESVEINDELKSVTIQDMPSEYYEGLTYTSENFNIIDTITKVTKKNIFKTTGIIEINDGLLTASPEHIHFIKRDNIWKFVRTNELIIGDILPQY